jgi:putative peptidoglycan lipid II flippase
MRCRAAEPISRQPRHESMKRLLSLVTLVGALALVGAVLGYVRNGAIASVFGISGPSDAYFVAIFLPTTLQVILVSGSLAPALVHAYIGYQQEGRARDAVITLSTVMTLLASTLALFVVVGVVFRHQLVAVLAPGLSEESARLSADLMLLTLPSLLLMGITALLGPVLNAHDRFFVPALGPVLYNLLTVGLLLAAERHIGIGAAALGGLVGAALHVALLVSLMRRRGIGYSPVLHLRHPGARKVLLDTMPVLGYLLAAYATLWLERFFASGLETGTVSIFAIAVAIFTLPNTVFNGALGTAIYPTLVRQSAAGAAAAVELAGSILSAMRLIMFALIPATVLVIVASTPLTRIAYGPGAIDDASVPTGGKVLAIYGVGLVAVGIAALLQRVMYASGRFATPLKIEIVNLALYVPLAALLSSWLAGAGLALARAVSFFLVGILSLLAVWQMGLLPPLRQVVRDAMKPLLAAAVMAATYLALARLSGSVISATDYSSLLLEQAFLGLVCVGVYLGISAVLRIEEIPLDWRYMLRLARPWSRREPAYAVPETGGHTYAPQEEA